MLLLVLILISLFQLKMNSLLILPTFSRNSPGAMFTSFPNIGAIFLGRAILGLGLGVVSVVVPVLLAEIAGDDNRGAITIMHQVTTTVSRKLLVVLLRPPLFITISVHRTRCLLVCFRILTCTNFLVVSAHSGMLLGYAYIGDIPGFFDILWVC